ncbi:MAG TPA: hypothetical protein VFQ87_03875 [Bradyrhizobium sp.]|jgi:hypothetical protein|nr:hypothetical protein [Bradyrhizobium sp.]
MGLTLGIFGPAAGGFALGWLAAHCSDLPRGGYAIGARWIFGLALPWAVLATALQGLAAGVISLPGAGAGVLLYWYFIAAAKKYNGEKS